VCADIRKALGDLGKVLFMSHAEVFGNLKVCFGGVFFQG
jgi:hypothetical protein